MNRGRPLTLDSVAAEAFAARSDARAARDNSLEAYERVGHVAREIAELRQLVVRGFDNLGGKVDECILETRALRADSHKLRGEVHSIRPKVDSWSDLEPEVRAEAERHVAATHRRTRIAKIARRALVAAILGGSTIAGAAGVATLLKECGHGVAVVPSHLPEVP